VSDIARRLNITRGSVSINLRTLKKRGWVETDEHRLVKLSPKGLKIVHSVMAKRVIVKTFLSHVLGISESQAENRQLQNRASHQPLDGPAARALPAVSDVGSTGEPGASQTVSRVSGGVSGEPHMRRLQRPLSDR
jgi:hypothetical protein